MPALFASSIFQEHETGRHPECRARLVAIEKRLRESGDWDRCQLQTFRPAAADVLARVHDPSYIETVEGFIARGGRSLDADTIVSAGSFKAAMHAVGAATAAVDVVLEGKTHHALALVRPPGHHALHDKAMGFCLFNNVAVAARHAQAKHGLKRILIVDWDVHHGNGTQEAFYSDPDVFFFSAHRFPFYPGTGAADETGTGPGRGTIFNLPLRFGLTRDEYESKFATVLADAAEKCRPELILISAGFDAHSADPIGSLGLESADFGDLTDFVLDQAAMYCQGRVVSLLEGGYNLDALAESVEVHLRRLLQREDSPLAP